MALAALAVAAGTAAAAPEAEPNDDEANATAVAVGAAGNGTLLASDTDFWVLQPSATGWIRLNYSAPAGIVLSMSFPGGTMASRNTPTPYSLVFNVTAGTTLYAVVDATSATGAYNFTTAFAATSSGFSKGPDETEPNDVVGDATLLTIENDYRGVVDDGVDAHDFWKVDAKAGDYITITLEKLLGAPGSVDVESVNNSLSWSFGYASIFVNSNRTLAFSVVSGGWAVPYTISFTRQTSTVLADGKITLNELVDDERFELFIHPAQEPSSSMGSVNLATGGDYMFGDTMCAVTGLDADVDGVIVEAGWTFTPVTSTNQKMVSSRTMTIDIFGDGEGCFRAMSYDEEGDLGSLFSEYRLGSKLTGDAATVMASIDVNHTDNAAGQLALWSVTAGTNEARARQWSASATTIAEAKRILTGVGVYNALNPAPPGGTNPGPTVTPSGASSAVPIIIGIIVVLVIIAIAAGAVAKSKQKKMAATPIPPITGATSQYSPGATGYSNPWSPPQSYAPATSYGYSQAPPQPPSYGYAAVAAPAPPPIYAPPQPPSYGVPVTPPRAPPPLAPPSYGAPVTPPRAPPPAPPVPPPSPVTPKVVETPASVDTTPCPQCGKPVAFYAPACAACGLELNWN